MTDADIEPQASGRCTGVVEGAERGVVFSILEQQQVEALAA